MSKILFLEINEVPYRLIDKYIERNDFPNLRRFFQSSFQFTTVATDEGELSPWITWPTLHRGMNSKKHNILFLGQDTSTFLGSPIWEELRHKGKNIGVFGAMQSWPPIDPGEGFYVPDTFAHDERCIPEYLEPLQRFNLSQVRANGRTVGGEVPGLKDALIFLISALRAGVTFKTLLRIVWQVIGERIWLERRARRPIFQTVIFWDAYRKLYAKFGSNLSYTSFFTNHIAGVMHRYWDQVFPEDFEETVCGPQEETMRFALKVLDEMIAEALLWQEKDPNLVIVFGSSMGQEAIKRDNHHGLELSVEHVDLLMKAIGVPKGSYRNLLAMVPQVAVEIGNPEVRAKAKVSLLNIVSYRGDALFKVAESGDSLSITVATPSIDCIKFDKVRVGSREFSFENLGIRVHSTDPGTGYHVPEGVLAICTSSSSNGDRGTQRQSIEADRVKRILLDLEAEEHPARFSFSSYF